MSQSSALIVASHPDDEILGVGATAAWHAARGDRVVTMILAEGVTSRDATRNPVAREAELLALKAAATSAAKELGLAPPRFGGFPDNRMDGCDLLDVVKIVQELVSEIDPDVVYTHHGGDLNVDHRITHQAVLTACRPMPDSRCRAIYTFETVSSTEWSSAEIGPAFRPQRFIDVTRFLDKKLAALGHYSMEMRPFPHARSVDAVAALARLRGSQAGCKAAEAFMVAREVVGG